MWICSDDTCVQMTLGELALLRVLRETGKLAHLPVEIIRKIIAAVNIRARLAFRRRRQLARYFALPAFHNRYNILLPPSGRTHIRSAQDVWHTYTNPSFYGPGF